MRVAIVDDEPLARRRLRDLLLARDGVDVVGEAADGAAGIALCSEHKPDVVLLDIAMPGMDGIDTARQLAGLQPAPLVVFCTAYDAHALSAFEAQAIDYLVKPVRAERLATALDRAQAMLAGSPAADVQAKQQIVTVLLLAANGRHAAGEAQRGINFPFDAWRLIAQRQFRQFSLQAGA